MPRASTGLRSLAHAEPIVVPAEVAACRPTFPREREKCASPTLSGDRDPPSPDRRPGRSPPDPTLGSPGRTPTRKSRQAAIHRTGVAENAPTERQAVNSPPRSSAAAVGCERDQATVAAWLPDQQSCWKFAAERLCSLAAEFVDEWKPRTSETPRRYARTFPAARGMHHHTDGGQDSHGRGS